MSVVSTGYIIIKTQQFSCFSFHLWAFPFKFGNYLDIIMMNGRQSMCVRYQVIFFFCCSNDIHRETISLRNYQWMWYNCLSSIKKTLVERQLILKEEQQHLVFNASQQNLSYILVVSFIGGGNRSALRKPRTCRKSRTNFIT
jgi:hypothetical protein